jgi:hypothetical protein
MLLACIINTAEGFDNKKTHPDITKAASNTQAFASYIINLGFKDGLNTEFPNKSGKDVLLLLQEGSNEEDDLTSMCRASNHFFNPLKTWDAAGLTNQAWWQPLWCASWYPINSTVTWATGYLTPPGLPDTQKRIFTSDPAYAPLTWDTARSSYYTALTATSPTDRDTNFAGTFKSIGHVLHLLQDMAVPPHVRDDFAGSHFSFIGINSQNNSDPTKWVANLFEYYVKNHPEAIAKPPSKPTSITRVTDLWDTTQFRTTGNPAVTLSAGLAEYTNANFVSDSTIFKKFPYPNKNSSVQKVNMHISNPFSPGETLTRKYYLKTGDGDTGYLLAGVGYLKVKVQTWPDTTTIEPLPPMDDYVHANYADRLLPRAVGYSAALLDYFFRGKINLAIANPTDISFRSVKVNAQNTTPGETMGVGEVKLIIRYKALSEWNMGGNKYQLNYPPEDSSPDKYTYKVSIPQYVDLTNPQTLTFDFSTDTLPYFFDDMTMQLVFKGKLGNEEGAVAVSELKPINGVFTDFTISLPASGVYAKATDGTLSATFNELKVTARTDIPAGLTGGNFELGLEYRKATTDPFQSLPVGTEPSDAAAYVIRVPEKNGVSILQPGTPLELTFDLSSVLLPVSATDVYLKVIYKNSGTAKTMAVGLKDISEPTPVDIFNNTDYVCLNNQWFPTGDPEAIALADQLGNHNGFNDDIDPYRHDLTNIYYKLTSLTNPLPATTTNFNFLDAGPIPSATFKRLGFVLTDYQPGFSSLRDIGHIEIADMFTGGVGVFASLENGTAVKHQTDPDGTTTGPLMYNMRGKLMWGGTGTVYGNSTLPANSTCNWALLPNVP